jgi:hypothetical protein
LARSQVVQQYLLENGLPTYDTDLANENAREAHIMGKEMGSNISGPQVSAGIATRYGGDVTPRFLTSQDITDFDDVIAGSGGLENPFVISMLLENGIIDEDTHKLEIKNGVPTLGSESKELIGITMSGLKKGIRNNNVDFIKRTDLDRMQKEEQATNLAYGAQIVNRPDVLLASNEFKSLAKGFATTLAVGWDDSGTNLVMTWDNVRDRKIGGKHGIIEDVQETVFDVVAADPNLTPDDIIGFMDMFSNFKNVYPDDILGATAIDGMIQSIKSGGVIKDPASGQEIYKYLYMLYAIGSGDTASTLTQLVEDYSKIEETSKLASSFMAPPPGAGPLFPREVEAREYITQYIQSSGLQALISEQREIETLRRDPTYKFDQAEYQALLDKIDNIVMTQIGQWKANHHVIQGKKVPKSSKEKAEGQYMIRRLLEWMKLEDATASMIIK